MALGCCSLVTSAGFECGRGHGGNAPGLDTRPVNTSCLAPERPQQAISTAVVLPFPNLSFENPTDLVQAPHDDDTWYIAERKGLIHSFANDEAANASDIVLDIQDRIQFTRFDDVQRDSQQWGIMSFEFHPQFPTMPYVYVAYNAKESPDADTRAVVSRFETADGGQTFDTASEAIILTQPYARPFHHLGNIEFGPDGYLYIGLGDGNIRQSGEGQDLNELIGAILRIDIDSASPYAIPPDNPLVGTGRGREELYAWGFRNPWGFSFDRASGEFWMSDVGGSRWEEVNLVKRGGNYGWNILEGNLCKLEADCETAGLIPPTHTYDHDEGQAAIGGFVYRGGAIPGLVGAYVFGDVSTTHIWGIFYDSNGETRRETVAIVRGGLLPPHVFAQGNDGEIYFMRAREMQTPRKIVPGNAPPPPNPPFPQRLSETGCVSASNPLEPASGLIPYGVNSAMWSDGAVQTRWMALPEGGQLHITDDGDIEFPVGTVLMQHLFVETAPIETRLLVHHNDGGWAGYSYEWLDDRSDAVLLPGSKTKSLPNGQTWTYPKRSDCTQCHTQAAGFALGVELSQLNGSYLYPSTGREANQLNTLEHIGLFDTPLPAAVDDLPVLSLINDQAQPVAHRVRSYFQVNCAGCHRPQGPIPADIDLRFGTAVKDMGICNRPPQRGDLGIGGAMLIEPGAPDVSIVLQRMRFHEAYRMPPLGTRRVDPDAIEAITSWILSEGSCQ